jgi:hypothetical protein
MNSTLTAQDVELENKLAQERLARKQAGQVARSLKMAQPTPDGQWARLRTGFPFPRLKGCMSMDWQDRRDLTGHPQYDRAAAGFVYAFCDATHVVLYIGQTVRLNTRMGRHKTSRYPWWHEVARTMVCEVPIAELGPIEAMLIHEAHPPYNRACPRYGCDYYHKRR